MNAPDKNARADYYRASESWAEDRMRRDARSQQLAWIVAGVAALIALCEAAALMFLVPLRKVEPYAVLVDRQTGFVEPLNLAGNQEIKPDEALVRSMLAQYVIAREGFNITALKDTYQRVALWSAGDARSQYIAAMQASNPSSPLASLPRQAIVSVEVRSISPLGADSALVRYATTRTDPGGVPQPQGIWAAVVKYRFSAADMTAENRLVNPLGFQVLRFSKSAEIAPAAGSPEQAPPSAMPVQSVPAFAPSGDPASRARGPTSSAAVRQ